MQFMQVLIRMLVKIPIIGNNMNKPYWTTKSGDDIPYDELIDDHLLNILSFIIDLSNKGLLIGGGDSFDTDSMWCETLYGKDVLEKLDYEGLYWEAKERGLV